MQVNITLDSQDIIQAIEAYLKENTAIEVDGDMDIELIPAKGTIGPSAVLSVNTNGKKQSNPPKPVETTNEPVKEHSESEGPYDDMERDEILALCEKRGIPVRSEGASKDKRTTTLIKELEAWVEPEVEEEEEVIDFDIGSDNDDHGLEEDTAPAEVESNPFDDDPKEGLAFEPEDSTSEQSEENDIAALFG
jgi:hypothetical protein